MNAGTKNTKPDFRSLYRDKCSIYGVYTHDWQLQYTLYYPSHDLESLVYHCDDCNAVKEQFYA